MFLTSSQEIISLLCFDSSLQSPFDERNAHVVASNHRRSPLDNHSRLFFVLTRLKGRRRRCSISKRNITCAGASVTTEGRKKPFNDTFHTHAKHNCLFLHFSSVFSFWLLPPLWNLLRPCTLVHLHFLILPPLHHLCPLLQSLWCCVDTQPVSRHKHEEQ